jgi:hypothetical protein
VTGIAVLFVGIAAVAGTVGTAGLIVDIVQAVGIVVPTLGTPHCFSDRRQMNGFAVCSNCARLESGMKNPEATMMSHLSARYSS